MLLENKINPNDLLPALSRFWDLSGKKIIDIEENYPSSKGSPVFTADGKYTTKGWTEWTQGFQYGSAILQFDITGDEQFLDIGKKNTIEKETGFMVLGFYGHISIRITYI